MNYKYHKTFEKINTSTRFIVDVLTVFPSMSKNVRGDWIKDRIQKLGPTYVKIGQFLSSRPDILGSDKSLLNGLKKLQDSVTPLPWETVSNVIEENIGLNSFKIIDQKPLASASIAQVHRATLRNGEQVVIKLKRPNINEEIQLDLKIIELWLIIISMFLGSNDNKIIDAQNMVRDIQNSILTETDFMNEVSNMQLMKDSIKTQNVKVPKVYKELSTSDMVVMEYVPSTKFRNNKDPKYASMLMDIFIQQFLQNGFIHGDPHEGNIALGLDKNSVVMYDLGHMIHLDAKMQSQMKILVFEIMTENVDGVISVMKKMPQLIEIRQEKELKSYIKKYIQYIKTIDIKVLKTMAVNESEIPVRFGGTIYEIVRVFGIIEGICLELDPTFNYESIFIKYLDVLLLDSDFISYKFQKDMKSLFEMIIPD